MTSPFAETTDWQELAGGAPPPKLLHAKPVPDAEEVLVLTYTCDLSFVEDVCVPQARATGARVTVVYDADKVTGEAALAGLPARDYIPVPVVCRANGAFHPKLVVIASGTDAVISIGSGNATTSGWHHNAEVWTHLRADGPTVPAVVGDLAAWLRRLPDILWIDRLGVERLNAVADLLTARPVQPQAGEPLLLANDQISIIDQLPFPDHPTDLLVVAAPFFDPGAVALTELIRRTQPAEVDLLLTRDVQCDPETLAQAVSWVGTSSVSTPGGTKRYHHGKVFEWWTGDNGVIVTGSANCTRAALLEATAAGGNCELALLQESDMSTLDAMEFEPVVLGDSSLPIRNPGDEHRPPRVPMRVLAVRWFRTRVEVVLFVQDEPPAHVVVDFAEQSHTVPLVSSDERVHTYVLSADLGQPGRTTTVQTVDGTVVAAALVTDVDHALTRITRPSPLEQTTLAALLGDEHQVRALFEALDELAAVRPVAAGAGGTVPARRTRQEAQLRSAVGPALVHLALGRDTGLAPQPADDDAVAPDDRRHDDADERSGESAAGAEAATAAHTVDNLDRRQREQLQRRFTRLVARSADWPLPAQLAAFRIVLIVSSAGLWPHPERWTPLVGESLWNLWSAPEDDAFTGEHAALVTVGLAAFRHGQLSCPATPELAGWFEEFRTAFREYESWLKAASDELLDRYTANLSGATFGLRFTGRNVREDFDWLLGRDPIDEAIAGLALGDDAIERSPDGIVRVRSAKDSRRVAVLVLDALRDHPGTHVVVVGPTGAETHGWWNPPCLRLVIPAAGGAWQLLTWANLKTGIASYARVPLPPPTTRERVAQLPD
ncbi:hypothetical protein AB0H83_29485 [Dactylosporangium sp. NPDC050688]|uniref:hypothetical protein n=1 Tax=Dactylosporangium sp. NPDC050688 TaxID=3157217 RepID=UPI00340E7D09